MFVFIGLATVGGCGSSGGGTNEGCCVIGENACLDGTNKAECDGLGGQLQIGRMCNSIPECGIVPPPTNSPPTQCQAPPLNTDFSDTGYFFVDANNAVLIGLTSDGENVALTLSDIPDSGAVIGLGASAQGENMCDIFTALILDVFSDASGECVRLENGEMLEVNDLVVADIPFGIDLSGDCEDVVPFVTADLNEARNMIIDKMKAKGVKSLNIGKKNIFNFAENLSVGSD